MAYVRKKGNQVAIVHGERDPDTGQVYPETLFTFTTRAEAYRALGKGPEDQSVYFRNLLEEEYPRVKFNWDKINKQIANHLDVLPDLAEHGEQRLGARFREGLYSFTREITQTDPQWSAQSARLLQNSKRQLEFLRDTIDLKLALSERSLGFEEPDNEFFWRQSLQRSRVNHDVEEMASELYRAGEYDEAIAAFTLLTESFPRYAEGHNYLGLMYQERDDLDKAIHHFEKTISIGRKLFRKRMRKDHYWVDLNTRPYMRGVRNLAMALNQKGDFERALACCETLDQECGDEMSAAGYRASVYLNSGQWQMAEKYALKLMPMAPIEGAPAAFAQFEQGKLAEARKNFLYAAFNNPLGIQILVQGRARKPKDALSADDYNNGVETRNALGFYLARRAPKRKQFFNGLLTAPQVSPLLKEAADGAKSHANIKDPNETRQRFDRRNEIQSLDFAEEVAASLA